MKSFAGQIYRKGKLVPGILHVDDDGKIVKVARTTVADDHTDFGDLAILPGAIDCHVHFRDPGATHKEDLASGSKSAAFGGVTTFVDMPNTLPAATSVKLMREKIRLAQEKSCIDFGFWGGATWYTGDVEKMLQWAVGMKVYLGATTGDLLLEDPKAFAEILSICGRANRAVILHCESQRILNQYKRTEMELSDHDTTRPPLAEVEAIYDVMKALPAIKPAPRIHIAHCASRDGVQAALAAKFSVGVCPHHILLTHEGWKLKPGFGKMNPPLRDIRQRDALLAAFAEGLVPILESDHAPHTKTEKDDLFSNVPAGVPGVETMMPLMLALVKAGKLELSRVVDALTIHPAAMLGLTDRGTLEKGMKADFSVVDLDKLESIREKALHTQCTWSPYDGHKAVFPRHVYLAGNAVVADRKFVGKAGAGRSIVKFPEDP
jgi:dihydroorotase